MLELVQLENGCYRLTVEYQTEGVTYFHEWYFAVAEVTDSPAVKVVVRVQFEQ